jgi:uncharacterized membrane protein HdeD (DUF308 family)
MTLEVLARNWWMMALRGGLAAAFGLTLLAWPDATLSIVVVLFGAYAVLDGLWAVISAAAVPRPSIGRLAIAVEGLVSLGLGALALVWPFVSREFVQLVAGWGVLTGILELITAAAVPRERPGHWLMARRASPRCSSRCSCSWCRARTSGAPSP